MKISRTILLILLSVVTLVVVLFLNLNTILKIGIQQNLSKSLAVPMTLTEVVFKPFDGYLQLNGFAIDNPQGFSSPKFLQVQNFEIQLQPTSLLSDRVEIDKLQLEEISIDIEQQLPRNNITEIFTSAEGHKQSSQSGQEKKFNLRSATINNVSVSFRVVQLGINLPAFSAKLPKVDLKNLNSENYQGLLMSEVFTKLVGSALKNVVEQHKPQIPPQIIDMLKLP
ncbi:AsmA family protein [Synechococcus sp. PCC 7502]|uniref:DUF748 domain-containing protein n=1 Tax=Synechococcus sp. PCC 7502 TaxID=1173263 RepID=UPI00029FBB2E|nr:AsmA family protein [Synechococcus sp. PCC 7502]AFY74180.1 AsmA family protein [Synechococcus sp. PCC 7502]